MINNIEKNINKIEKENILERPPLEKGETLIVLQRHQAFDKNSGHLTEAGKQEGKAESSERLEKIINEIPGNERQNTFFLTLSSDTTYPGKFDNPGKRSMETGIIFTNKILEIFKKNNIPEDNLLNISREYKKTKRGEPRPTHQLRISPDINPESEFGKLLKEKYPENHRYVQAFDKDWEKEARKKIGAEGPEEIAERIKFFLSILNRYSRIFHKSEPDSRLIIFMFSHYDTVSPFTKIEIANEPIGKKYLPVELGAGIPITINKNREIKAWVDGKDYAINLTKKTNT